MEEIKNIIMNLIKVMGIYGPLLACFLIVIESIIPILPLALFITVNFLAFGSTIGFIISWIFTIMGCMLSFTIFRKGIQGGFNRLIKDKEKLNNMMKKIDNIGFLELTLIIAIPFTPAFLVNIAAGLSSINAKKFFASLLIGKISLIYFWGYIGTSFVESLTNPKILIQIILILLITYIISLLIKKAFKL